MTEPQSGFNGESTDEASASAARRERVVAGVMSRIAAAPPAFGREAPIVSPGVVSPPVWVDFTPWRIPTLAAAAVVLVAAGVVLGRQPNGSPPAPRTVAESLGYPAPVARWLETGDTPPLESLRIIRGGR